MPQWFVDALPDFLKQYAVAVAVTATASIGGGLLVMVTAFRGRMTADEKALLRWGYDSPGNSILVIEAFGMPRTVLVGGLYLTRERERWLIAWERLKDRGLFEVGSPELHRLRPAALAIAKTIKAPSVALHGETR